MCDSWCLFSALCLTVDYLFNGKGRADVTNIWASVKHSGALVFILQFLTCVCLWEWLSTPFG